MKFMNMVGAPEKAQETLLQFVSTTVLRCVRAPVLLSRRSPLCSYGSTLIGKRDDSLGTTWTRERN